MTHIIIILATAFLFFSSFLTLAWRANLSRKINNGHRINIRGYITKKGGLLHNTLREKNRILLFVVFLLAPVLWLADTLTAKSFFLTKEERGALRYR